MNTRDQIKHNVITRDRDFVIAIAKMHVKAHWWDRFIPKSFGIYNALEFFKNKMNIPLHSNFAYGSRIRSMLEPTMKYFLEHHFTELESIYIENIDITVDGNTRVSIKDHASVVLTISKKEVNGEVVKITRKITLSTLNPDSLRVDGNIDCVCMWVAGMFRGLSYMQEELKEPHYEKGLVVCFDNGSWRHI